jgi:hypothetical protein
MKDGFIEFGPLEIVSSKIPWPREYEICSTFLWYIRVGYIGGAIRDMRLDSSAHCECSLGWKARPREATIRLTYSTIGEEGNIAEANGVVDTGRLSSVGPAPRFSSISLDCFGTHSLSPQHRLTI